MWSYWSDRKPNCIQTLHAFGAGYSQIGTANLRMSTIPMMMRRSRQCTEPLTVYRNTDKMLEKKCWQPLRMDECPDPLNRHIFMDGSVVDKTSQYVEDTRTIQYHDVIKDVFQITTHSIRDAIKRKYLPLFRKPRNKTT